MQYNKSVEVTRFSSFHHTLVVPSGNVASPYCLAGRVEINNVKPCYRDGSYRLTVSLGLL